MQLRGRDVEQWMSHRRLPEDLRRYEMLSLPHCQKRICELVDSIHWSLTPYIFFFHFTMYMSNLLFQ